MSTSDDHRSTTDKPGGDPPPDESENRRSFLGTVMWGSLALPLGVGVYSVARFVYPLAWKRYRMIFLCRLEDIPSGVGRSSRIYRGGSSS